MAIVTGGYGIIFPVFALNAGTMSSHLFCRLKSDIVIALMGDERLIVPSLR